MNLNLKELKKNELDNLLFVFKESRHNSDFFIRKFSNKYNVSHIFLRDKLNKTNNEIKNFINEIIQEKKINTIIFEGDHLSEINFEFIDSFNKVKKGICLLDDYMYHEVNLITAQACDFVLTTCPISASKFEERGINSFFTMLEGDGNLFKKLNLKKKYDVLFFGSMNSNRIGYINKLKENNVNLKIVDKFYSESKKFSDLVKLINESKIVINFSKSYPLKKFFSNTKNISHVYQLKGRPFTAGLCGTLCVSEQTPAFELIFNDQEIPIFKNENECLKTIQSLLSNPERLNKLSEKFFLKSQEQLDTQIIVKIKDFIERSNLDISVKNQKIPIWYEFIFLKQLIWIHFRKSNLKTYFKQTGEIFMQLYKKKIIYILFAAPYLIFYSIIFLLKNSFRIIRQLNK